MGVLRISRRITIGRAACFCLALVAIWKINFHARAAKSFQPALRVPAAPKQSAADTMREEETEKQQRSGKMEPPSGSPTKSQSVKNTEKRTKSKNTVRVQKENDIRHLEPFSEIEMLSDPVPRRSATRSAYAELAKRYLRPFAEKGNISRDLYMEPFRKDGATCDACFMVQVQEGRLYIYDPRNVATKLAIFHKLRMEEAVHYIRSAVLRGMVFNTEMVIGVRDSIMTASKEHPYSMSPPGNPRPLFSIIQCNISDNIPFPMHLSDSMRRGIPGVSKSPPDAVNLVNRWDKNVGALEKINGSIVQWDQKINKAVFRGRIRKSAYLRGKALFDQMCHASGRGLLWKRAQDHVEELKEKNKEQGDDEKSSTSVEDEKLSGPAQEPVLDVKIGGECGGNKYESDGMTMEKQNEYKYSIHAEGNSFWADRLLLLLFGSNAVIKQTCPCGMFFEPLLRPYEHYIPTDYFFNDLVQQTQWAVNHDEEVVQIVHNARKFAGSFLSRAAVQTYVDELLIQYTELLEEKEIKLEKGAVRSFP